MRMRRNFEPIKFPALRSVKVAQTATVAKRVKGGRGSNMTRPPTKAPRRGRESIAPRRARSVVTRGVTKAIRP